MKLNINGDIAEFSPDVRATLDAIRDIEDGEPIELNINSYGGDAFLGISIMNSLRAHTGEVTVTVTGIAASAASIIAMGADKVKIYNNAQLMIHNPWTIALGNADDLRKAADDLDKVQESARASYTHRIDEAVVEQLLADETYLTAAEAKQYGLVDEIIDASAQKVDSKLFAAKAESFNAEITQPGADAPNGEHVIAAKATEGSLDIEQLKNDIIAAIKADAEEKAAQSNDEPKADAGKEPEKKILSIFK